MFALVNTTNKSFTEEWIVAYVFLALSLLAVLGTFIGSYRKRNNRFPSAKEYPWFRIVAAPVAYAAWVVALPKSPILDWGTPPGYLLTLVLVGTTIVLGLLGLILDKVN